MCHRNLSAAVRAQDVSIAITLLPRRLGLATLVVKIMSALLKLKARPLASAALPGSSCCCVSFDLCQTVILYFSALVAMLLVIHRVPMLLKLNASQCGTPACFPAGSAK